MKEDAKITLAVLLAAVGGFALGALICLGFAEVCCRGSAPVPEADTVRVISVDTVTVVAPVPEAVRPAPRHVARLPIARGAADTVPSAAAPDSVDVAVPVETAVYDTDSFRAVVTGAWVTFDSLTLYPRRELVTVTRRERRRRWHVGPSVGVAVTPDGVRPYVGVSLSFSLIDF